MELFTRKYKLEDVMVCKVRTDMYSEYIITTVRECNKLKGIKTLIYSAIKGLDGRKFEESQIITSVPLYYRWNDKMQGVYESSDGRIDKLTALALQEILNKGTR